MRPDLKLLEILVNLSAGVAHILGTDNARPISIWAWRFGSRSCQYAVLAVLIALPASLVVGRYLSFGELWGLSWSGCWAFQALYILRLAHRTYRKARKA